jgi:transcriptional regulator with XRE-family HTH domain
MPRETTEAGAAAEEGLALAFGAAVKALRQTAGLSLNELARRAGVDPAYIHRIEARVSRPAPGGQGKLAGGHAVTADVHGVGAPATKRPPLPRRGVVIAIAAALGSDSRQTDELLAVSGHAPAALLALGGWDPTLASVAELLADPRLDGPARAEFREVVRILARRWRVGTERQR